MGIVITFGPMGIPHYSDISELHHCKVKLQVEICVSPKVFGKLFVTYLLYIIRNINGIDLYIM